MKEAAKIVSQLLKDLESKVKPGLNVLDLEKAAVKFLKKAGAESYNKDYQPKWALQKYPNVLCVSVNDAVSHGIPKDYILKEGDLVTIDAGIKYKGFAADAATTIGVGKLENKHDRLLRYAKRALYIGIGEVKAGLPINEIGNKIEKYVITMGYVVDSMLMGHVIGKEMHEDPKIPMANFDKFLTGKKIPKLKAGQVICLEPHITFADRGHRVDMDGWTLRTRDSKYSAMFEHMVLVKKDGFEILTDHIKMEDVS